MRFVALLLLLLSGCEIKVDSRPSSTPPTSGKVVGKDYAPSTETWVTTSKGCSEKVQTPEVFIIIFEGIDSLGHQQEVRTKVSGEMFGRLGIGDDFDSKR